MRPLPVRWRVTAAATCLLGVGATCRSPTPRVTAVLPAADRGCLELAYADSLADSLAGPLPRTLRLSGRRLADRAPRGAAWYAAYERDGAEADTGRPPWVGRWRAVAPDTALVELARGGRAILARMTLVVGADGAEGIARLTASPRQVVAVYGARSLACYPYRL